MSTSHEHFVSMSTSHDQGAVLYVVSRSGKILGSEDPSRRFVEGEYIEGELEGWIFWGSSRRGTGSNCNRRRQDASVAGTGRNGFVGNPFDSLGRVYWKKRIPFVVWGDETESLHDVFAPLSWRQSRPHGRKNMARRRTADAWKDTDGVLQSLLSGCVEPQELFRSDSCCRLERNYKIGLSQLAILQKWEPGTRELAARWAAWLLKMLRKTRPRALQHLLFTMCSAVLPVICCSLVREQWFRIPDQELCRCVDIVWRALNKSYACFTPAQWEILEEKLIECRQLQMKVASLADEAPQGSLSMQNLKGSPSRLGMQPKNETMNRSSGASEEPHQLSYSSRDKQLSNALVQNEGVSALVRCALREKLFTPQSMVIDGKGVSGVFGSSGTIVSLLCPLSGRRVKVPARGRGCSHPSSFDLQSYLEEHVKNDLCRSSSVHQRKKPKMEIGAWCCPICGSNATWPQIVVDRVLLRILEVLPEHMPQVCLLPNGRWRVVWSPVGVDSGNVETTSRKVAVHPPFKSLLSSELHGVGQFKDLRHDAHGAIDNCFGQEEVCGYGEVQILHKAYKAWKGVDHHLAKGGTTEQIQLQWGAKSTFAVWRGDQKSSMESLWRAAPQTLLNIREKNSKARTEITVSSNKTETEGHLQAVDDVRTISEAGTGGGQNVQADEDETQIASGSKLILEALQGLGGVMSACDKIEGTNVSMRVGQPKARPKLMAKKN